MTNLLQLEQVMKRKKDSDEQLFAGVTAVLQQKERVALLGASGQGKSTLLRLIARLIPLDSGTISLHGKPMNEWRPNDWRRKVAYVAQQPVMLQGTVEANLRMASVLHGIPYNEERAQSLIAAAGLGKLDLSKPASELSGGEKQRVALIRTLMLEPEVLLLDEVTSSLDPGSKTAVESCLNDWLKEHQASAIWITHDLEQARTVSEQVWFLGEGALLEQTASSDFFQGPRSEAGRAFLHNLHREGGGAASPISP
ncbi:ATP-binding cassette domain-containing protein [Paenibacillus sp. GCM10023252]|uniref:ABC transporter ATP-binding protein n=1 Tax=Paenibacillus sp. GCM10023252 TaxID=3252649 RepID=UPI00361DE1A5